MILSSLTFWPRLILGGVAAGLIGWGAYSVYDAIRDRGYRQGAADTIQAEKLCTEGTVCADAADARAAAQKVVVDQAKAKAKAEAEAAAAVLLEQETAARAAAESREKAARAAASAAERRYLEAIAKDQACAEWASRPVPCPLS